MKVWIFCAPLLFSIVTTLPAQRYVTRQYRVENGLPTDLTKAITQDQAGNLWIATDEGFVRYNGARFEAYPKSTHSNYTKGFFRTRHDKLIAIGDLDLLEVVVTGDSVEFKPLCPVGRTPNDSTLSYPKSLYEDRRGLLWVSESQAVVRMTGRKIKRYEFDIADRTPQFLRSFSFFEDAKGALFTVSVAGNVFRYDGEQDKFLKTDYKFPGNVEFVAVLNRRLVIGAQEGLYVSDPQSDGSFGQPKLAAAIHSVSYVAPLRNGNYFVATRGSEHFLLDSALAHKSMVISAVSNINHVYLSGEEDIWLATNEGVVFMQEAAFQGPLGSSRGFIECVAEDAQESKLYYATAAELYAIDPASQKDEVIINAIKDSYFQSLVSTKRGLWAANSFRVLLIQGKKVTRTFDFSDQRMFVTSLAKDAEENVWLTIPGRRQVLMIDNEQHVKSFGIPLGENGFINDVRDGGDGIYVASNGKKNYLFYKAYADTVFHNISVPVDLAPKEELNAFSLFADGSTLWLATTAGLIKYDHKTAQRVFLGEGYRGVPVRSICADGKTGFLLATSKDLLYYDVGTGDYNLFASARNLSGITINNRSILISRDKKVWIGASRGLFSSSRRTTEKSKTIRPRIVYASVDGKGTPNPGLRTVPYNILLSMIVSSVTFPEEERVFEFRLADGMPWKRLDGPSLNIITSNPGGQQVQLRARKTGMFGWSDTTNLTFSVPSPFWMTPWFYLLIVVFVIFIIGLTSVIVRSLHIKQKIRLEARVAERTQQLEDVNKELEAFSYSVSHDLRAPLRSILGFTQILEDDHKAGINEDGQKALGTIKKNATKMNTLIDDLLRFSRVLYQGLKKGPMDTAQLVDEIVASQREAGYTETEIRIQPLPSVVADRGLISQVWSNLISNAVKYSSKAAHPRVDIGVEEKEKEYIFHVRDNGAGFDMQFAEKLFGVFQRLHSDREFPGTGIGLALVRRILTRHDGRIWAEAKVNEGATFYFSLPR
jgi:signal transduction histidine kinase/ligand-binding sensor domain-containing protein